MKSAEVFSANMKAVKKIMGNIVILLRSEGSLNQHIKLKHSNEEKTK